MKTRAIVQLPCNWASKLHAVYEFHLSIGEGIPCSAFIPENIKGQNAMIVYQQARQTKKQLQNTFMIADRPIEPGHLKSEHILTPEELADRLKVPVTWIYENTRSRASIRKADPLPNIRMGKYLRFYWPEVEKWLERHQGGQANA